MVIQCLFFSSSTSEQVQRTYDNQGWFVECLEYARAAAIPLAEGTVVEAVE